MLAKETELKIPLEFSNVSFFEDILRLSIVNYRFFDAVMKLCPNLKKTSRILLL